MLEKVCMPKLGESIIEGTIVNWLKQVGDKIEKDENILIISTDKVEAEIPSTVSGILKKQLKGEGDTIEVGGVLGEIETDTDKEEIKIEKKEEKIDINKKIKKNTDNKVRLDEGDLNKIDTFKFISPLVKRMMEQNNIKKEDIKNINGSGYNGRINKQDMLIYLSKKNINKKEKIIEEKKQNREVKEESVNYDKNEEKIKISSLRKTIMNRMIESRKTSAHVSTFFEIDYTEIDKIRRKYKELCYKEDGVKLTYTTFIIVALCKILKKHKYLNSEIRDNSIILKKSIDLGVAIAITNPEPGLIVPVIKKCDEMNIRGIAKKIEYYVDKVNRRKMETKDLTGGSFTITNPGSFGAIIGVPIINQPETAILCIGGIEKKAKVLSIDGEDVIAVRKMGTICLSFDHRIIDGATADHFMGDLKKEIETCNIIP